MILLHVAEVLVSYDCRCFEIFACNFTTPARPDAMVCQLVLDAVEMMHASSDAITSTSEASKVSWCVVIEGRAQIQGIWT